MEEKNKPPIIPVVQQRRAQVSDLYNSLEYGLESVTIIQEDDGYRLIVRNIGYTLYEKTFPTVNEAQEGFLNRYRPVMEKAGKMLKPKWTDFFDPNFHLDELTLYIINQTWIYNNE